MNDRFIFELQFFPPVYFFIALANCPVFIEGHEHYQKRSFRNKCMIANAQGTQTLTVPLKKGKHEQQLITEVEIAYDEPWQKNHLASLKTAYQSAPFFDYYFPELEKLYHQAENKLFDFNWNLLFYLIKTIQMPVVKTTTSYEKKPDAIDNRGVLHPKNYSSFILPKYSQVFEDRLGYLPNLSILDLLFCNGPETRIYLQSVAIAHVFSAKSR